MNPDLTIVLLGKTGVGKSASGNTILGRAEFQSELSLRSLTTEISERRGSVFGKQISVVDTPGILDSKETEKKIEDFCQALLKSSRRCLFLVTLRVGRFTKEDQEALKTAMKVLGGRGMKKSYLLFTGGDALKGKTLKDFIFEEGNEAQLPKVVQMFDGRYHLFDNESDDEEQVRNLLLKSGHLNTEDQPDSPVTDPDLTIVLLGKTGVGKSASGNTILGRAEFQSKMSLRLLTTEISERRGSVLGKQISVVDTPGILYSKETERKIEDFCQDLLRSSRRCLFLVTLRVGRFTEEDQEAVKTAMKVLGRRGMKKSYLLFTGGDALKGQTLEDFIFEEGDEAQLPDVVQMFDGRYHLFDNESDDEEQVSNLLLKSGHLRPEDQPDSPAGVPKERRIMMLGLPGAGKSSSGNTILRSERFEPAADFDSVSTETTSASASVEGCEVTVVDTPGFTDKHLTPEQLYLQIMKSVVEASPGVHALVIVVRVGRITEADIKLFELLPKLFEGDALKYSMVLFTHGDNLKGQSIEGLMEKNRHVSKLVSMCGGRYCVFENRRTSREQVRSFLSKIDEMVSANGGQHYTDQMFRMAETFLREERRLRMAETSLREERRLRMAETFLRGRRNPSGASGGGGFWEMMNPFNWTKR